MRLTRFLDTNDRVRIGIEREAGQADAFDISMTKPTDLLEKPLAKPVDQGVPIAQRLAPIAPPNIYCVGLNYRQHAHETNEELSKYPVFIMKPTSAVQHPDEPIIIPAACERGDEVDYEVELAIVIGKAGRDIAPEQAYDHVLGYTVANDVSARKWQKHAGGGQWVRAKSFDTFCPLGPVLVTSDEIEDPQNLAMSTTVNGQTLQDNNTNDMIFTIREIIAFLSRDTTLLPGTVILTGTPEGVGVARTPPIFLKPGDSVTCTIESIGSLTNLVEAAE